MPAKKAAKPRKSAAKAAPRKAPAARRAAKPAARKAKPAPARAKAAKPSKVKPRPATTARASKSGSPAPASRDAVVSKPKSPPIPQTQVAEARSSFAALQAARANRRQNASDEDEDGTGTHNLLLGPRNVRPYRERKGEMYMGREQLEHFRNILNSWKRDLMEEVDRTMLHMKDEAANFPDPNDRATQESEFGLELRTRDRERKLLKKIESALARIDDGTYGYCEETGDEIGLRRLEARPVATLCVEAQERRELAERQFRDREDQYR